MFFRQEMVFSPLKKDVEDSGIVEGKLLQVLNVLYSHSICGFLKNVSKSLL